MANLLRNFGCQSLGSSSSPSQSSISLFSPRRGPAASPPVVSEFAKLNASVLHAGFQAQDKSSVTSEQGTNWWEKDLGATIGDVHSMQELMDIIANGVGKLVIVEFFASWCGSCRALYPKLCKLAMEHQDIVIVKVNFDENKAFCKSMNVKVLPYFHFYRGSLDQIDAFSCSILKLQKLKDAIVMYKVGESLADQQSHPLAANQIFG